MHVLSLCVLCLRVVRPYPCILWYYCAGSRSNKGGDYKVLDAIYPKLLARKGVVVLYVTDRAHVDA